MKLSRLPVGILAALCGSAVTAGAAGATTFCVHPAASQHCAGTAEPDLQTALTAARTAPNDTHRNTIIVGNPGAAPSSGYSYNTANPTTNPVDIIGAGQGTTTLTYSGAGPSTVLAVNGDGSSVSNLRVLLPAAGGQGVVLSGGSARGILITSPGPQTNSLGAITLAPSSTPMAPARSFTRSTIAFPTSGGTTGQTAVIAVGSVLVTDISVRGQNIGSGGLLFAPAAAGYPNNAAVRRVRIRCVPQSTSSCFGLLVSGGVTVKADNIALSLTGGPGSSFGALVTASGSANSTLNLSHASIYGNADLGASPSSFGIYTTDGGSSTATTNVRNSIIRNFFYATLRSASGSGAVANVRYDYSDYDFIHRLSTNSSGGTGKITNGIGNLDTVNPLWLNPVNGDFRIPATSPVINKGAPGGLNPLVESITDVLGHPRISNHRRDMGAVEYQFPPPRFKLGTGTFDSSNGKARVPAKCKQPATDRCVFKLKLKAKLKAQINGKSKHKTVTLHLKGSATGGKTKILATKIPSKALPFVQGRSKITFGAGGTVTDNEAAVAPVAGKVKLKAGSL